MKISCIRHIRVFFLVSFMDDVVKGGTNKGETFRLVYKKRGLHTKKNFLREFKGSN